MKTSRGPLAWPLVVQLAVALLVLPVLLDLALGGAERAFGYVAADTFYYLAIARNVVEHGMVSFDQSHLTNGFHPLWQAMCVVIFFFVRVFGADAAAAITWSVIVGVIAGGFGLALFARALHDSLGRTPRAFVLLPVGLYALAPLDLWLRHSEALGRGVFRDDGPEPLFGTCWELANGMESGVTVAAAGWAFSLLVRLTPRASARELARLGAACALVIFARLDHALLVLPMLASVVLQIWRCHDQRRSSRLAALAALAGAAGVPVLAYLIANQLCFGSALPTSGALKSTFPTPSPGNFLLVGQLAFGAQAPPNELVPRAWRMLQLVVPLMAAGVYLSWRALNRRVPDSGAKLGVPLALGMLLLGLYDLAYVPLMQQGHWYFPVSIPGVTLLWLATQRLRLTPSAKLGRALIAVAVLSSCAIFFWTQRIPDYHAAFRDFYYREAPRLKQHFRGREPKLFSIDDGIVAFATGFPTMSGTGLAVDAAAIAAARTHRLGDLAVERGYNYFTGFSYVDFTGLTDPRSGAFVPAWIDWSFGRKLSDPSRFDYALVYRSQDRRFGVLRVTPRRAR